MTFTNIIAECRDQCRVPNTSDKTAFIRRQINLAMDEWSRYEPAWWMEARVSLTLATGNFIALPSRFTCMSRKAMRRDAEVLTYTDWSQVEDTDPDLSERSSPDYWSIVGKYFAFYPGLSSDFVSSGALNYRYYQTMLLLNTTGTGTSGTDYGDSDSPDPPLDMHEGVILGASYRLLRFDGVARWAEVQKEFYEFIKLATRRGPVTGAAAPVSDGGFANIVRG